MKSKIKFTEEQIKKLNDNIYVDMATSDYIKYSNKFKDLFIKERENGKKIKDIFIECGFDINAIGERRMARCSERWTKVIAKGGTFTPGIKRINYGSMTIEDRKIAILTKEIKRLKNRLSTSKKNNRVIIKLQYQNNYLIKENKMLKKDYLQERRVIKK